MNFCSLTIMLNCFQCSKVKKTKLQSIKDRKAFSATTIIVQIDAMVRMDRNFQFISFMIPKRIHSRAFGATELVKLMGKMALSIIETQEYVMSILKETTF